MSLTRGPQLLDELKALSLSAGPDAEDASDDAEDDAEGADGPAPAEGGDEDDASDDNDDDTPKRRVVSPK